MVTEGPKLLRSLLSAKAPIVAPGAWDPLTGLLIERVGFPALMVGGWNTGASLAVTEPLLTMTEQVSVARAIARVVRIPVIVDGHTGYGDPVHVMRAVREYEDAGFAAMHIEDQVFPKRVHYYKNIKHVIPVEEMLEKIRYALKARRNPDFVIIARTDVYGAVTGTLDETIRRMRAYQQTGADVLMPFGSTIHDFDEAKKIREAVPDIPMLWLAGEFGGQGEPSIEEIFNAGFQIIMLPLSIQLAAASAVLKMGKIIQETGRAHFPDLPAIQKEVEDAIGVYSLYEIEESTTEKET